MPMHYQLYHFDLCPYCAKVRRAIQTMGAAIELVDIRKYPEKKEEIVPYLVTEIKKTLDLIK